MSGGQARAPFSPPGLDHKASVLGAHPGTETVAALALQVAWLECSLHGAIRSQKRLSTRTLRAKKQVAQGTGFTRPLSTAGLAGAAQRSVDTDEFRG